MDEKENLRNGLNCAPLATRGTLTIALVIFL
jgi:hypothetical protein